MASSGSWLAAASVSVPGDVVVQDRRSPDRHLPSAPGSRREPIGRFSGSWGSRSLANRSGESGVSPARAPRTDWTETSPSSGARAGAGGRGPSDRHGGFPVRSPRHGPDSLEIRGRMESGTRTCAGRVGPPGERRDTDSLWAHGRPGKEAWNGPANGRRHVLPRLLLVGRPGPARPVHASPCRGSRLLLHLVAIAAARAREGSRLWLWESAVSFRSPHLTSGQLSLSGLRIGERREAPVLGVDRLIELNLTRA